MKVVAEDKVKFDFVVSFDEKKSEGIDKFVAAKIIVDKVELEEWSAKVNEEFYEESLFENSGGENVLISDHDSLIGIVEIESFYGSTNVVLREGNQVAVVSCLSIDIETMEFHEGNMVERDGKGRTKNKAKKYIYFDGDISLIISSDFDEVYWLENKLDALNYMMGSRGRIKDGNVVSLQKVVHRKIPVDKAMRWIQERH